MHYPKLNNIRFFINNFFENRGCFIIKIFKNAKVFFNNEFVEMDFCVRDEKFYNIEKNITIPNVEVIDCNNNFIIAGLIDIHTHGSFGVDFNNASYDDILKACKFYNSKGVTSVFPTILTDTRETTIECIENIKKAKENCDTILGIHLEGPFLSKEYKGAMPEELLINPNVDLFLEYQNSSDNLVKIITISPELDGACEFVEKISKTGVICSIGHSGADQKTVCNIIKSGVTNATHLGNAMKQATQHNLNVCGSILNSNIYAEIICDGLHVNKDVLAFWFKVKGYDKMIAVTDSIMATGLEDGEYKLGINEIEVINQEANIKGTNVRAGSTLTAINSIKNISEFLNIPFSEAIRFMTENPAKALNIFDMYGSIDNGKFANFLVLDENNNILNTYVKGKCVY